MSLHLKMLQIARLAIRELREVKPLISDYILSLQQTDGGFADRSGESDLYYTVFALETLRALQSEVPSPTVEQYLKSFADGEQLDFIHLCCLVRCWAALEKQNSCNAEILLQKIEKFRAQDGGYHNHLHQPHGTAYASFLALGAYQDMSKNCPQVSQLITSIDSLRAKDGGYANTPNMQTGITSATAAAAIVLKNLQVTPPPDIGMWLLARCLPQGGFQAAANVPLPDLLSTATALHALACLDVNYSALVEPCLDFVDTLWTNSGGFYGHWAEEMIDAEYTYYGILAIGHLCV
jgi:prenyltransferase beta subunit